MAYISLNNRTSTAVCYCYEIFLQIFKLAIKTLWYINRKYLCFKHEYYCPIIFIWKSGTGKKTTYETGIRRVVNQRLVWLGKERLIQHTNGVSDMMEMFSILIEMWVMQVNTSVKLIAFYTWELIYCFTKLYLNF